MEYPDYECSKHQNMLNTYWPHFPAKTWSWLTEDSGPLLPRQKPQSAPPPRIVPWTPRVWDCRFCGHRYKEPPSQGDHIIESLSKIFETTWQSKMATIYGIAHIWSRTRYFLSNQEGPIVPRIRTSGLQQYEWICSSGINSNTSFRPIFPFV